MLDATTTASRAHKQAKGRKPKPFPLALRRTHLAYLVVGKHKKLPRDGSGWTYVKVAAEHCPNGPDRRDMLLSWLQSVCALPSVLCQVDAILDRVPPRRWNADKLAWHLRVSDFERSLHRIWTIGAYDVPKAMRIKRRKENARRAAEARRRDNDVRSREQYLAGCLSQTRPWEAFGIKRRAWERRGKPIPPTTQVRTQYASLLLTPGYGLASSPSRNNGHHLGPSPARRDSQPCQRREKKAADQQEKLVAEQQAKLLAAISRLERASTSQTAWQELTWEQAGAWVADAIEAVGEGNADNQWLVAAVLQATKSLTGSSLRH
jgi:hypothetical protein